MKLVNVTKGGQSGNRTCDTRIFSPLLYQLSYLAVRRELIETRKIIGDFPEKQVISSFSHDKPDEVLIPSTLRRQSELLHPESYFQRRQRP